MTQYKDSLNGGRDNGRPKLTAPTQPQKTDRVLQHIPSESGHVRIASICPLSADFVAKVCGYSSELLPRSLATVLTIRSLRSGDAGSNGTDTRHGVVKTCFVRWGGASEKLPKTA